MRPRRFVPLVLLLAPASWAFTGAAAPLWPRRPRVSAERPRAAAAGGDAAASPREIVVALGCFWLPQSYLAAIPRVRGVVAGYAIGARDAAAARRDGGGESFFAAAAAARRGGAARFAAPAAAERGGAFRPSFNAIGPFCEALRVTYLPAPAPSDAGDARDAGAAGEAREADDAALFAALLDANPKFRPTPSKPRCVPTAAVARKPGPDPHSLPLPTPLSRRYRAALYHCEGAAQAAAARRAVRAAGAEAYVEVDELGAFFVAEARHQGRSERLLAALAASDRAAERR